MGENAAVLKIQPKVEAGIGGIHEPIALAEGGVNELKYALKIP